MKINVRNMKSCLSNRAINFWRRNKNKLLMKLTTFWMYFVFRLQGVVIGQKCIFYGKPHFEVNNGGKIVIGESCVFRSTMTSNRIGLNHRVIISATPLPNQTCFIHIGNNCGFSGTSIWCFKDIYIGNNVRCGANTLIMDGDAHFEDIRTTPPQSIRIEDNVFLGANVVVKKGVTIGTNSVIGMNSVVTHNIPANCVAVGIPCKVIKQL